MKNTNFLIGILFFCFTLFKVNAQDITSPEKYFGFQPGSDGMLFNYQPLIDYLSILDKASDKLEMREIGYSPEGKKMYIVFISAAENIKKLDTYKEINKKLALSADIEPAMLDEWVNTSKVFAMTTLSMHANEVAPSQAAPLIAYELITSTDADIIKWMNDVVLMMVPSQNPDGMDMIVNHYKKYKGTKYDGCSMPGVYNKYVGHDDNRDYVTLTQSDTRAIANAYSNEWYPQVLLEKHQMWSTGTRYFVPPNHDPIAENINEEMWNWTWIFGSNMAKDMTSKGLAGVSQHYLFDDYWPGSTETSLWMNIISLLTEAASVQYAKPVYVEPNELTVIGKGLSEYKKSINMPLPWEGGWWHLSDIVEYERVSTLSYLKTASLYRKEILKFRNNMCREAMEKGINEAPYYFILPGKQQDIGELVNLIKLLNRHGVKVFKLAEDISFNNLTFTKGDVIVPLNQPYRALIKEIMEKQYYPERHYTPGGELMQPYDITSWSVPLHKGLTSFQIDQKIYPVLSEITKPESVGAIAMVSNTGRYIALSPNNNVHYKIVFDMFNNGKEVKRAIKSFKTSSGEFPAGTFIINATDFKGGEVYQMAYLDSLADLQIENLKNPKIALMETWDHDMDAGWTRWVFDSYNIRFEVLHPADIVKSDLSKYTCLVFPDADKNLLLDGKYKSKEGTYYTGEYPPEYEKGITAKGLQKIFKYIDEGGSVISWGSSVPLFLGNQSIVTDEKKEEKEEFTLPVTDISDDLGKKGLSCPGTLLKVKMNTSSKISYGLPSTINVFSRANPVFRTSVPVFDMDRRVIGTYPEKEIVVSGYADKIELVAEKPAIVWVKKGKGEMVFMAFCPQFRGSTDGTFKLLFNSLLLK
jgi:hypothetical protein